MSIALSTVHECRGAYREILQGYTFSKAGGFYVKHFRESDLGFIDTAYNECSDEMQGMGVPSQKEKLAFLNSEGYWTPEDEDSFTTASLAVKDAYIYYNKLIDGEQKENFKKTMIPEQEENLANIQKERSELLEPTIETICDKKLNEMYVYHALYKDDKLKEPFFSSDEFDDLNYLELADVVREYNHITSRFSERNLKKVGVNYFFLNSFFMCEDDPVKFYGNNVLELTMYQLNLFSNGKFNKSILMDGEEPPDQYLEESYENGLDELVNWYALIANKKQVEHDRQKNSIKRARR